MTKFEKLFAEMQNTQDTQRKDVLTEFFGAYENCTDKQKVLIAAILQKGGHTFVGVSSQTDKMKVLNAVAKKNTQTAVCVSKMTASLNKIYENAVNNERERESKEREFVASSRTWGRRVSTEFVVHKGQIYITLYPMTTDSEYIVNGQKVSFDTWETMLQPSQTSAYRKAKAQEAQGTEREIVYRDFALNSITSFTIDKKEIVLQ